jgi:hypothetical protein
MFRAEGGARECEQGERWSSSCGVFDAVYAAFRRSVSRCFERGGARWSSSVGGFDAVYAAFRRSVSRCLEVIFILRYTFV